MATATMSTPALVRDRPLFRRVSHSLPFAVLLIYSSLLFFVGLADRDLNSSHEARAAQNAQTLLDTGEWLLPKLFDGHVELQKPPLFYWLVAALGFLNGGNVDVWCVRLPSAASALGCVCWLYFLGWKRARPLAGLLAGFVLASCLHFTWLARVGRIDMPLTLTITVALGSLHHAARERRLRARWAWSFVGYTALGLGLLLKGPIACVLPLIVTIVKTAIDVRFSATQIVAGWRNSTLWWGVPWVLVIAGPWFVWTNIATDGELWNVFFWYHNVERGLGGTETLAAHPWWFYGPRACVDLLPWSLALPFAAWWFRRDPEENADARDALIWFATVVCFLSCMSFKRADYLLPAYPGFAIFLGSVAERWFKRQASEGWVES